MTAKDALDSLGAWQKVVALVISLAALAGICSAAAVKLLDLAPARVVAGLEDRVDAIETLLQTETRKTDRILCLVEAISEDNPPPARCVR